MEQYCDDDLLVEAQSNLWSHVFVFLKSMSLKWAVELGIPDAIHRHGGPVSIPDLVAALNLPPARLPSLRCLMRMLSFSRLFTRQTSEAGREDLYGLTPTSRLLVDDAGDRRRSFVPLVHMIFDPVLMAPSLRVGEWFKAADGVATPFEAVHGSDLWGVTSQNPEFNATFNVGMAADGRFIMDVVVRKCGHVFRGLRSLVDVGGGTGAAARAIAEAFPHVKCAVLDLPQVVERLPADGLVEFFAGSMFERVPPADAVMLKIYKRLISPAPSLQETYIPRALSPISLSRASSPFPPLPRELDRAHANPRPYLSSPRSPLSPPPPSPPSPLYI